MIVIIKKTYVEVIVYLTYGRNVQTAAFCYCILYSDANVCPVQCYVHFIHSTPHQPLSYFTGEGTEAQSTRCQGDLVLIEVIRLF